MEDGLGAIRFASIRTRQEFKLINKVTVSIPQYVSLYSDNTDNNQNSKITLVITKKIVSWHTTFAK